jgi:DNA-binding NarL/FixJ family response regulator
VARLTGADDIEMIWEAEDGLDGLARMEADAPDVLIIDIQLPDINGLEVARIARRTHPHLAILFITGYDCEEYAASASRMGASGCLPKTLRASELITAVRRAGTRPSDPLNFDGSSLPKPPGLMSLTRREREVLRLIGQGHRNATIASSLVVTEKTVEFHITNILRKLGVSSRSQAAIRAREVDSRL